jgi:NTP pyrophosphatase (non-canonical NTP hydrolase)
MEQLDRTFTLAQLQAYVQVVRTARSYGAPLSPLKDTVLHLVEEVGEVVRAVRRNDAENLSEELADSLFYILAAANAAQIDLASALAQKEERNRQRFGA